MPRFQRVDWFRLVTDLQYAGVSMREAARRIGVAEGQLRNLRKGGEPLYPRGDALIELWCEVLAKSRTDLPMT